MKEGGGDESSSIYDDGGGVMMVVMISHPEPQTTPLHEQRCQGDLAGDHLPSCSLGIV